MKTGLIQAQAQRSEFFLCLVPVLMLAMIRLFSQQNRRCYTHICACINIENQA